MAPESNGPGDNWDEIFTTEPANDQQPKAPEAEQPLSRRQLRESEGRRPQQPHSERATSGAGSGSGSRDDGPKRRRGRGWIIALGIVVVLLGGAAGGASWAWANYEDQIRKVMGWELPIDYEGSGHGEATVVIKSGDGGEAISAALAEAGVTKTTEAFYKLLLVQDPPVVFFPGHYQLKQEMSAKSALEALQDPANKIEASVLIKEGWSVDQTIDALVEGTGLAREDFVAAVADPAVYGIAAAAPSVEGYLFPAKYSFDPGIDAATVINTLIARTYQSLDNAGVAAEDRHRVLTIASLIQREAGSNPDDFYKVSRVIQNRIAQGMLLQFDSTAHYGYSWAHGERLDSSVFSSSAELGDDNPYNTYKHVGLPIGPIGAAGDLAIGAALKPADGDWLYFVTVNLDTGETKFTNTNAEHNAAVDQLRKWCRETQSPNCD
ncbi:MAG TPA: endolytic transglycosylase MltG [Homoserinimonas sp.]|nr:endolytic transglycosylase MltG [Homoserinimonas sp.]